MAEPQTEWLTRAPAPALAQVVDRYVGYRLSGLPAGVHRGLPSRHLTFIVSIGPAIDVVAQTDPRQAPDRYRCVLSGLQASPALIAHDGNQEGVAIELTPLGCRALFGVPAAALWDTSLELSDVAGAGRRRAVGAAAGRPPDGRSGSRSSTPCSAGSLRADPLEPALRRAWQLVAARRTARRRSATSRATIGWTRQHLPAASRASSG